MIDAPQWYVLSLEELMILASGVGVKCFYGLTDNETERMTQETYLAQVFSLTQKGFLHASESCVVVEEKLQGIFRQIRDAEYVLACYQKNKTQPDFCCYCGEKIAMIEKSTVDYRKVRVCLMPAREAEQFLHAEVQEKFLRIEKLDPEDGHVCERFGYIEGERDDNS